MDLTKIVKRSWEIIWKNRFLWWLGALTVLTEGGVNIANWATSNYQKPTSDSTAMNWFTPRALGADQLDPKQAFDTATSWFQSHASLVSMGIFLVIAICLFMLFISYSARAGLIKSVDQIESGKEIKRFGEAFRVGRKWAFRLFLLHIVISVLVLAGGIMGVVLGAGSYLLLSKIGIVGIVFAITLIFALTLAFIAYFIIMSIILRLAERNMILNEGRVRKSITVGYQLFLSEWKQNSLAWLIQILINIVVGIALMVPIIVYIIVFVIIGVIFYALLQNAGAIAITIVGGLGLISGLWFSGGILTAYISTYWTLVFRNQKE